MRYLSVASGIEAATLAWEPLGWTPAAFAEIDPFPSAVLAHHWPHVPNLGDFTRINTPGGPDIGAVDLLVGGTPCQAFSVAGQRGGLADPRGELSLEFCALARRVGARWVLWENVPGVLSSGGGRDFGAFLGALGQLGYGFAYRVLDAQYAGVPQRRRRVFVVGYLGDWRRAAAVLFERHSLSGNPPPRRDPGARVAGCLEARAGSCGPDDNTARAQHIVPMAFGGNDTSGARSVASCLSAKGGTGRLDFETETFIASDTAQITSPHNRSQPRPGAPAGTLNGSAGASVAFHPTQDPISGAVSPALGRKTDGMGLLHSAAVRRLTPRECERLQGMPDDHTMVPYRGRPAKDGPRYKAIGNSMAVPVMRWIGERIVMVDARSASM